MEMSIADCPQSINRNAELLLPQSPVLYSVSSFLFLWPFHFICHISYSLPQSYRITLVCIKLVQSCFVITPMLTELTFACAKGSARSLFIEVIGISSTSTIDELKALVLVRIVVPPLEGSAAWPRINRQFALWGKFCKQKRPMQIRWECKVVTTISRFFKML